MKVVSITDNKNYYSALGQCIEIISAGGVVALPTDTVYGLVCDATNEKAVAKIFRIKGREDKKPISIFVKDIPTARKYAYISDKKAQFLKKVWPGKVTVVFYHKEKLPSVLTGGKDSIGVRVPDYEFVLRILERLSFPLAQSSANISTMPPARSLAELKQYFSLADKEKPDLIIDAGAIEGEPSMVVDFTKDKPIILRSGFLTKTELLKWVSS